MLPPTLSKFRSRPMEMPVSGTAQVDPIEHVERVHVAAGRDRRTGHDRVECNAVDRRRSRRDQRAREHGILEAQMAPISPLLTVSWPILRMWVRVDSP